MMKIILIKNKTILNYEQYNILKEMKYNKQIISENDKYLGKLESFPNSKLCVYCEKYVDKKYYIPISPLDIINTTNYCIHCWAWLNFNDVNLSEGLYFGNLNQNIVFEYIKNSIDIHKNIECKNENCLFNCYIKLEKNNKLNSIFCKEIKEENKNIKKDNKIFTRDIQIDWKKSSISI